MRKDFYLILGGLLLLSLAAWQLDRSRDRDSALWAVDVNRPREEQLQLFRELHPDLALRLDPNQADLTKILVQSIGGVGPDLFCVYDPAAVAGAVKSGIALDITDEVARWNVDYKNAVWEGCRESGMYGGRIYGIPNNVGAVGMWFNKDAFDEAGVPYPSESWTWEEFLRTAGKLVKKGPDGRIVRYAIGLEWGSWPHFLMQWGGRVYTPDGTRSALDSPQAIAAIQFMYDLVYQYKLAPTPAEESAMATSGGWGAGSLSYFANGRFATALGGRWWLMLLRQRPELRCGACESPHGPVKIFQCTSKATLINATSKHRKTGLAFLRYLLSPEYNKLICDQGDALGPLKNAGKGDPEVEVWRGIMKDSRPIDRSDFINGQVADRLIARQLDLVKNRIKTPADAMRDAALDIDIAILKNVLEDPSLQERYEKITGKKAAAEQIRTLEQRRRKGVEN